jgi:hypothetical protein
MTLVSQIEEIKKNQASLIEETRLAVHTLKAGKFMEDTILILTKEDRQFIQDRLQMCLGYRVKASNIFRASRDGWSPQDFHNFCDS